MQTPADRTSNFYERAIEFTHHADKIINLVLGYMLAIASVLGFMDVLSNGQVLQYASWLFYVWLAIMGLGVDFQILLVIGRIPDLFKVEGKKKWVIFAFNVAFLLGLGYMSVVIGAIFVQHRDVPGTIAIAMNTLGINGVAFVYERAALATLLLALMAVSYRRLKASACPRDRAPGAADLMTCCSSPPHCTSLGLGLSRCWAREDYTVKF